MSTCNKKPMSEGQARQAAANAGRRSGVQYFPIYCAGCRAWHITKGK